MIAVKRPSPSIVVTMDRKPLLERVASQLGHSSTVLVVEVIRADLDDPSFCADVDDP
jgi:hypothetical protein